MTKRIEINNGKIVLYVERVTLGYTYHKNNPGFRVLRGERDRIMGFVHSPERITLIGEEF